MASLAEAEYVKTSVCRYNQAIPLTPAVQVQPKTALTALSLADTLHNSRKRI